MARELRGIAGVELRRLVELGVAFRRRVRAYAPDAFQPAAVARQNVLEMRRMRTVHHEELDCSVGRGVDLLDRVTKRLAAREPPIRLDGEGDRDGHLRGTRSSGDADGLLGIGEGEGVDEIRRRLRERLDLRPMV